MKKILNCQNCMYFPVRYESEKCFLNSYTYRCPNCRQLNLFNNKKSNVLENEFYIENQQDILIEKNQKNDKSQNQQIPKTHRNQEIVLILIQNCKDYTENFYINPINPYLRNSLNINKQEILKQKNHQIFSLSNQFLTNNFLKFPNLNNLKSKKRIVSKAEHIFYCIDQYIKNVNQILMQLSKKKSLNQRVKKKINKEEQNIKYLIISVNKDNKSDQRNIVHEGKDTISLTNLLVKQNRLNDKNDQKDIFANEIKQNDQFYRFEKEIQFDYSTYRQLKKYNLLQRKDDTHQKNQKYVQIENKKLNEINQRFQFFFRSLYQSEPVNPKQSKKSKDNQINKFSQLKEFNLKTFISSLGKNKCQLVSLFGDKFDFDLINYVCDSIIQKENQNKDQRANYNNIVLLHSFGLTKNSQLNIKQNCEFLQGLFPKVKIHHACLYEPLNKERITIHSLLQNILKNSFQKYIRNSPTNLLSQQHSIKNDNQITQLKNTSHSNQFYSLSNTFSTGVNPSQNNFILIFLKQPTENQQMSDIYISYRLKNESLFDLFEQLVLQMQNNKIQKSHKFSSIINGLMLPIVQHIKSLLKNVENLIFDRLICRIEKKLIFYVFHFDSLINENYEQMDFLDQNYLPQELKNYSLSYQNIQLKKEPFKKLNKRVCLADQPQTYGMVVAEFQDESDERESL